MNLPCRSQSAAFPLLLMMTGIAPLAVRAQDNGVIPTTNKVLVVVREFTKPGKDAVRTRRPRARSSRRFSRATALRATTP